MIDTKIDGEWYEIYIPAEWSKITLTQLLREYWRAPKKLIHSFRMNKEICVNGQIPDWTKPLKMGDILRLKILTNEDFGYIPSFHEIEVLYEDPHLLVVNKPANMDTHPNTPEQTNTLANAVAFYLKAKGEHRNIKHIHRLDHDTTGAIIFAKHSLAGSILDRMLEERSIKRTYEALVHGIIHQKKGTIREPIGRDRHHATRRRVSPTGQIAITHFEVIKIFEKEKLTFIQCHLDTGRTHQIRVHLGFIGHPLVGDKLYGGKPVLKRQALHAAKIEFIHPFTMAQVKCLAEWPDRLIRSIHP